MNPFPLTSEILLMVIAFAGAGGSVVFFHHRTRRAVLQLKAEGFIAPTETAISPYISPEQAGQLIKSVPGYFILLILLHEDDRFFSHHGFNWREIRISLIESFRRRRMKGGSSISQQLAKMLFLSHQNESVPRRIWRKLEEMVLTVYLERFLSKREILALYLATVQYVVRIRGVEQAAGVFFEKRVADLSVAESEILISLIPGGYRSWRAITGREWQKQPFDYAASYEKLMVLQRWLMVHFPACSLESFHEHPVSLDQIIEKLEQVPLSQDALSPETENLLQMRTLAIIEEMAGVLQTEGDLATRTYYRALAGAPLLVLNLLTDTLAGRFTPLTRYMLASTGPANLELLGRLIRYHRLGGLIRNIRYFDELPERLKSEINRSRDVEAAAHIVQLSAFQQLSRILGSSVQYILYKGLDSDARFYEPRRIRPGGDIDLQVARSQYPRLRDLMKGNGYTCRAVLEEEALLRWSEKTGEAIEWIDTERALIIDIHVISDREFEKYYAASVERTLSRCNPPVSYRALSNRQLLQVLCEHGSKHGWSRLLWLEDVSRLLREFSYQEVKEILEQEDKEGKTYSVLLAVFLAKYLVRVHKHSLPFLPPKSVGTIYTLSRMITADMLDVSRTRPRGYTRVLYQVCLHKGIIPRLRALWFQLFSPTPRDFAVRALPARLFWAYSFIRICRGAGLLAVRMFEVLARSRHALRRS